MEIAVPLGLLDAVYQGIVSHSPLVTLLNGQFVALADTVINAIRHDSVFLGCCSMLEI